MNIPVITFDPNGRLTMEIVSVPVTYTRWYRLAGLQDNPTDDELDAAIEACAAKPILREALEEAREYTKKEKEDDLGENR